MRAALVIVLVASGCAASQRPAAPRSAPPSVPLLASVPASSPYVVATLRPIPLDVIDGWAASLAEAETPRAPEELLADTLREPAWLRTAGLGDPVEGVAYRSGRTAVMRARLADRAKLEHALASLFERAGVEHETFEVHGRRAWRYLRDGSRRIVTTVRDEVVLATLAEDVTDADLPEVLGHRLPAEPVTIADLRARAGPLASTAWVFGWVDMKAMVAAATAPCDADLELVSQAVIGMTVAIVEGDHFDLVVDVALTRGLAHQIASLRSVGMTAHRDGAAAVWIGAAIDLEAVAKMLTELAQLVTRRPFTCEELRWANGLTPLANLPFDELRGLEAELLRFDRIKNTMTAAVAFFGAGARNAVVLITQLMGGPFVSLRDDGNVVTVKADPTVGSIHMVARGWNAAMANNKDGAARVSALLEPTAEPMPFFEVRWDFERLDAAAGTPTKRGLTVWKIEPAPGGITFRLTARARD